ncbi:transporter substrate-binding domain-containing protein [Pseudomonas sp. BN414]|uniref:substrate-binding periplasmic protein n=1 Tax=Pseudomonas sp. BN414 TaxID=2567888 RepID=UPI0024568018|nr:transporter substrate-binding domain-containing protein [Pseudomonas sp. BN414]MDH4567989.1 transporter substrate-binding domain-containing protein [Pseudomonas sp. BN414]
MRFPLALWALLSCLSLSFGVRADLRLATLEYPPYCSQSLPQGGSIIELTTRAFATQGYKVQVDFMPWARVRAALHSGHYQGALALWPREVVEENLHASRPLFYSELGFFVRTDTPVDFKNLSELKGRKVGVVRGYGYPASVLRSGFRAEEAVDDISNLRKLDARRFDLVLLERVVGQYLVATDDHLRGKLQWQPPALERIPLLAGFTAPHPGQPDWAQVYERGLRDLLASGEYTRILERHNVAPN